MPNPERRRWPRLELAIPLFVTGQDSHGRQFTELATALNISAGGALVVLPNRLDVSDKMKLEIPHPPLPDHPSLQEVASEKIDATAIRTTQRNSYQLVALQFERPLRARANPEVQGQLAAK